MTFSVNEFSSDTYVPYHAGRAKVPSGNQNHCVHHVDFDGVAIIFCCYRDADGVLERDVEDVGAETAS